MQKKLFIILALIASILLWLDIASAQIDIPWASKLEEVSIHSKSIDTKWEVTIDKARDFGGSLLGIAKTIISGFALIYIVLIGVYMVIYSDDESELKKQKTQIFYVLLGFIFINVPSAIYQLFTNTEGWRVIKEVNWTGVEKTSIFWTATGAFGVEWFLADIIDLLKVIAFIAAIIMFTWGAFSMILSRGKDEYKEEARNRLVYGIMGLLFLGTVELWARVSTALNIHTEVTKLAGTFFGIGFFFAAPVAIFFLMLGAYYYITSGWDEDRAKKGKAIIFNTGIATLILLASFSFIKELSSFFTK